MNDIVKVAGQRNGVPLIEFLQKGRGVTNITGEKLYEKQVIQATAELTAQCSLDMPFFIVLADRIAGHYEFYFELSGSVTPDLQDLGRLLERYFCQQNDEYKQKLASGRLKPLQARQLKPGTATHFRTCMVERGQKDGQFKVRCLAYKDELDFDFSSQLATESPT
jgi:hypothetical protein